MSTYLSSPAKQNKNNSIKLTCQFWQSKSRANKVES